MSLPHRSVATIDNVEFVNLQPSDVSPLVQKCQIKVFYVGKNRNGSYISKEVATDMAKTIRTCPIVGYYVDSKQDFSGHGEKITIDDEGIHFDCQTFPYGFVAPDAEVWFQKFNEQDDFGNEVEREYLMTTGYLWTSQYPEAQKVFDDNGKPQSMELDNSSLEGHWARDNKDGMEFFIINDAIVSKLCILGDDVEPCFEGASVTAPQTSRTFTKIDNNFKKTLFDMIKELEFALQGGNTVNELENTVQVEEGITQEVQPEETFTEEQDNIVENATFENEEQVEEETSIESDFEKKDDDEEEAADEEDSEESAAEEDEDDEDKKPQSKNSLHSDEEYAALETKFNELQTKFNALTAENEKLIAFKNTVEDAQKDELIAKFYMLSDEDKADVVANKRTYSLEQIEEKLAVICFRKKVNFDLETSSKNEDSQETENVVTFNYNNINDTTSDWVKAVEETQKRL